MKQLIISPSFALEGSIEGRIDQKGVGIFKNTYPHGICRDGSWIGKEDVILYYNDGISKFTIDIDKDVKIERTVAKLDDSLTINVDINLMPTLYQPSLPQTHVKEYSFTIAKLGNIEDRKSITYEVNGTFDSSAALAIALNKEIQKNNIFDITLVNQQDGMQLTFNNKDGIFKVTGKNIGVDDLKKNATPSVLSKEYIKQLQSQCAAGKGFTDTANGAELYPSYMDLKNLGDSMSEGSTTLNNVMYTLTFTNKRKSSKTKDEVVNQTIHIITQTNGDNLKYMFGFEPSPI